MSTPLRPRNVPEILDASFQVLRGHYLPILTATGVLLLPTVLLGLAVPELAWAGSLLRLILANFASAATVLIVADLYLGRSIDGMRAVREAFSHGWRLIGVAILAGLITVVGFFLCIVPGFLAMLLLFAASIAVVVEGKGPIAALERSVDLANDNMLRILLTSVMAQVIVMVAGAGVGVAAAFAEPVLGPRAAALADVFIILLQPFPAVVSTVLYFDIRVRKEGFGMDDLSDLLHTAPGAAAARP
jgi:hypothetical protein